LENTVPTDCECRQPAFFRVRHFVSPPKSKRRRRIVPIATGASNFFALEDSATILVLGWIQALQGVQAKSGDLPCAHSFRVGRLSGTVRHCS
jgi:hypothetical protein